VLCIDPANDQVDFFGNFTGKWLWHGAVYSPYDQAIYAIPCNASRVLRIDPLTKTTRMIGPELPGTLKWYGGLMASDGCIYGMPNCADQVLRIDPKTQTVSLFGDYPHGDYQWHGGVVGQDQCLYAVPSHACHVLKIDPQLQTTELIGDPIKPGLHRPKGKYKFGGAVTAQNGAIYCLPSDADQVLKIDIYQHSVQYIGPTFALHNKWQNGYLASNQCIYGIPCNMDGVLQINTLTDDVSVLPLGDEVQQGFEKWEGGAVDDSGILWCVPQNSKQVLRLEPQVSDFKNMEVL